MNEKPDVKEDLSQLQWEMIMSSYFFDVTSQENLESYQFTSFDRC